MGIFGKLGKKEKEKEKCPICGKEMSFFKQTSIQNGTVFICDDCENKLRGTFNIHNNREYDSIHGEFRHTLVDDLDSLPLEEAKRLIGERDVAASQTTSEMGGEYESIFKVEEVFNIAPKAKDVGIPRAKAMKNKMVARGAMLKGSMISKDSVVVKRSTGDMPANIIETIRCSSADFNTSLAANTLSKKLVEEGTNAWIVLDVSDGVAVGDTICK